MPDKFANSSVRELRRKDFEENFKVKKTSNKPGLMVFYYDWCGFCNLIAPELKSMAKNNKDIKVYAVHGSHPDNKEVFQKFGISGVPHIVYVKKDGTVRNDKVFLGERKQAELKKFITNSYEIVGGGKGCNCGGGSLNQKFMQQSLKGGKKCMKGGSKKSYSLIESMEKFINKLEKPAKKVVSKTKKIVKKTVRSVKKIVGGKKKCMKGGTCKKQARGKKKCMKGGTCKKN